MVSFTSLTLTKVVALLSLSSSLVTAQGSLGFSKYAACQAPTTNPLTGCPAGTIYVHPNSTYANFHTIQSAVLSLPNDTSSRYILVGAATYNEQVNVTRSGPLTLLGQTTVSGLNGKYNSVRVTWAQANIGNTLYYDNAPTSVLTVAPNLDAALTGAGITGYPVPANNPYGNTDFRAYNIDFDNNQFNFANGPALALSIGYANTSFYRCGFYSYQDTIYVGKMGNTYMVDSIVAGQTDFFYGFGTLWVERSQMLLRNCGGGIVAWKGSNTTFTNYYGAYMHNSSFVASNSSIAPAIVGKCALGRAWNINDHTVYMNSYLDATIMGSGYTTWASHPTNFTSGLTLFGEYNSTGPGFNATARAQAGLTQELTAAQVAPYNSPQKVFLLPDGSANGNTAWIDFEFVSGH